MLYGTDLVITKATQSSVSTNLKQGVSGAPQLLGLGCGGSLTGKHADKVFTDDIVNVKDRVSAAERERIKLLYMELQNIRNRGGRIFNTGTPWHKDDAFQLMGMSPSLFAANYELKHIADEDAMFTNAQFFKEPQLLADGIGHIDASYGGADYTAFTCVRERSGIWYAHIRMWHRHVDDCLDEILKECKALRIGTVFCESNADKGYLRKSIIRRGHPCCSYQEAENKYIKISTHLRSQWANVRFLDCEQYPLDADALNQVLDYSENAAHDDMPDSLASAIRQWQSKPGVKFFKGGI